LSKQAIASVTSYGAMTQKLWSSVISFFSHYMRWYFTLFFTVKIFDMIIRVVSPSMATAAQSIVTPFEGPLSFLTSLLWFIVLTMVGLAAGGIVYTVVKDGLESLGLSEQMERHKVAGAFGGIEASSLAAASVKWYIVLLFMNEGTLKLGLPVLSRFIGGLVDYMPDAASGLLILGISMVLARFAAENIRGRKLSFSEIFALGVESTIIFFGIVLSLPILFPELDVSILTDSFKILMVGVSAGIAIAMGLGLKDHMGGTAKKFGSRL